MPFYEYQCKRCGHALEAMQKITASPLKKCPECGKATLQRLMSAPVFRLKGGGWYETDFKSDQDGKRNLADKPEADAPKEDKKDAKPGTDDAAVSGKDATGKEGAGKDGGGQEAGSKDAGGKDTGSKDTGGKDGKKAVEKSADKSGDGSKHKSSDKSSDKSGSKTTAGSTSRRGSPVAKKSAKVKPVRKVVAKAKRRR